MKTSGKNSLGLFVTALVLAVSGAARAASITWDPVYTAFPSASTLLTNGTYVDAVTTWPSDLTVAGIGAVNVTFHAANSLYHANTYTGQPSNGVTISQVVNGGASDYGLYGGGNDYKHLVDTTSYGGTAGSISITGLTVGHQYQIQIFGPTWDWGKDGYYQVDGQHLSIGQVGLGGTPQYLVGTWTADGGQTLTFAAGTINTANSNHEGNVFAVPSISLREIPPTGTPYEIWANANAGGQSASEDYDHDGVSNGLRYFMGAAGTLAAISPPVVTTAGVRTVTWPRDPTATVASWMVQVSDDLAIWDDVIPPNASINTSNPNEIVYTLPTGAKQFCRLVVTP